MLLIFTQNISPRISYVFKHICTRILGIEVTFTSTIDSFIGHQGSKASYGSLPLGNELFFQSHGLLQESGVEYQDINIKEWDGVKYFFGVSLKSALPFDLFAASFYLLTRYEEYLPHVKDEMGRFPSKESLAFKNQFLQQPLIDIWALKFKEILVAVFPEMTFQKKEYKRHLFIQTEEPYKYKTKGFLRAVFGYSVDFFGGKFKNMFNRFRVSLGARRDPYDSFKFLITTSKNTKSKLSFFFLLGEASDYLNGVTIYKNRFKQTIKYVSDYTNVGLILSIKAQKDLALIKSEKRQLEDIILQKVESTYNAAQIVDLPNTYRKLVEMEVSNDYTMCYSNKPGFRASTCTPFLFYDLDYEIKTPLKVIPVAGVYGSFLQLSQDKIKEVMSHLQKEIQQVQGDFVLGLSNACFGNVPDGKFWRSMLTEIFYDKK